MALRIGSGYQVVTALLSIFVVLAVSAVANDLPAPIQANEDWCGTQRIYEIERALHPGAAQSAGCDDGHYNGPCDESTYRDNYIPGVDEPIIYVRLMVHTVALDDGSNPFTNAEAVQLQVDELNANYAPAGIQFIHQFNIIRSSAWRSLAESEIDAMKLLTAVDPTHYLNVWVTQVEFGYSFGTFPWSYDAQLATGGVVMGHFHWMDLPDHVFAHEIGHTLGLFHTFNGVEEVTECGPCYEVPLSGSSFVGDLCGDTPPTPEASGPCIDYPGADPCSGLDWGYTMPENYMGYNGEYCLTTFTPQQQGRMRCWIGHALDGWALPFTAAAAPALGPVGTEVQFEASTWKDALAWAWDFGDGAGSPDQNPTHQFDLPGYYDVSLELQTGGGNYQELYQGLVSIYADTINFAEATFDINDTARIDISIHNYVPLTSIQIPFSYSGPLDIKYRYVTAVGKRAENFELVQTSSTYPAGKLATIFLGAGNQEPLPPGDGAVVTLVFYYGGTTAGSNPIQVASYSQYNLIASTHAGDFVPEALDGVAEASCCIGVVGDANYDGQYDPTIGDVSTVIDFLFINGTPFECFLEADANLSGAPDPGPEDITIGDVSTLIDFLFITNNPLSPCP